MPKLYTRTGDNGTTSLVGGVRISKSHIRIEAYGTIDELNSQLGLLVAMMRQPGECQEKCRYDAMVVERVQSLLFNIGTYLATDVSQTPICPSACLDEKEIGIIEGEIDLAVSSTPENHCFVLPGGSVTAAQAHVCRSVCRRAERRMIELAETTEIDPLYVKYVNRLSDYLYALSRKLNFIEHIDEKKWENPCK